VSTSLARRLLHETDMKNTARTRNRDLISEEEFNRIVVGRGIQLPEDDSRGDSDTEKAFEVELGEHYPENSLENLDEALDDIEQNDEPEGVRRRPEESTLEQRLGRSAEAAGTRSSTWPDRSDLDDVPMHSPIELGDRDAEAD
jgi:hypothetical protein